MEQLAKIQQDLLILNKTITNEHQEPLINFCSSAVWRESDGWLYGRKLTEPWIFANQVSTATKTKTISTSVILEAKPFTCFICLLDYKILWGACGKNMMMVCRRASTNYDPFWFGIKPQNVMIFSKSRFKRYRKIRSVFRQFSAFNFSWGKQRSLKTQNNNWAKHLRNLKLSFLTLSKNNKINVRGSSFHINFLKMHIEF